MARRKYVIKPVGMMGVSAELPDGLIPSQCLEFDWSTTDCQNVAIRKRTIRKRPGLTSALITISVVDSNVYGISDFLEKDGTLHNLFLTDTDLCKRETGTGNTFSYLTDTGDYDSKIDSITDAANSVVTFKAGTTIQTDGAAAGDMFIIDDDHDSDSEDDSAWLAIKSVDGETQCTLNGNYATNGTTGSWTGSEKNGLIRRIFTAPTSPVQWSYCTVGDKFCFTNGNEHVWYWSGSGYATALDSTNATTYKFCIEFADRLILANQEDHPTKIAWSKNLDPTDWTDETAGSAELLTSGAEITGLGKIGSYLVVYTKNSIIFGYRTGVSTAPIAFLPEKPGIGCRSHPSIINANGTNYFVGRSNFYKVEGMQAISIGDVIAEELFSNVAIADITNMVGVHYQRQREILWRENTGGRIFVYNYHYDTWNVWMPATGKSMGIWTLSSDEEVIVHSGTTLLYVSESTNYDAASTAIQAYFSTPVLDFSDQDPEAAYRQKKVYMVRLWYKDITSATPISFNYYVDDDTNRTSWHTGTIPGDGDGTLKYLDMHNIVTGYTFRFDLSSNSATADLQIEKIEIFYELGGKIFSTS